MARPFSFGGIELDVNAGHGVAVAETEPLILKPDTEDPFRILILGDFGGLDHSFSRPVQVDRDNLNEIMRVLRVEANIPLGGNVRANLPLKFEALEDFEPDSLFAHCDLFRVLDDDTDEIQPRRESDAAGIAERTEEADVARLSSGSLLDAIVQQNDARLNPAAPSPKPDSPDELHQQDELKQIVERMVEPYLQPRQSADASKASAERQQQLALLMRAILHTPRFQALEAAWRSLDFLVRNIESDNLIKIYVFDISKERLEADLLQNPEFRASDTYRVIVEESVRTPGAEPWALLIGNYGFDPNSSPDVDLLAELGLLARAARAPFLAEAIPSSGKTPPGFESWQALRQSSHASWLGLAIPRLLLRLPYGKNTTTIESFDFEEMPDVPQHGEYLWGNPAFGLAVLVALSFSELGWDFRPGLHREIAGLPLHVYKSTGVTRVQPCAELLLTESDCDELLDGGLMPFASVKDRDSVRLIRFESIAEPPAALSGRWI